MKNYLLLGYNSGGYKDSVEIYFDGTIEKLYKPDIEDEDSITTYFRITHLNGNITDEEHEFMDKLIYKSLGYHESFLVTQVIEVNEESLRASIEKNDISTTKKLLKAGVVMKKKSFIKKFMNYFILYTITVLPLFGSSIISLDFSGLESLSRMGHNMTKATQNVEDKTDKIVIAFKPEKEVLDFHNKYIDKNPEIKNIINLIPAKPQVFLEEDNIYEIIYFSKREKLKFTYYIDNNSKLSNLYIMIEQQGIPVWTQENVFYERKLTPSRSREIFYDGTERILYYEYSKKNDKVNIRQELDYDEAYKLQETILLCNEEDQAIINTKLPISSYIQDFVINLKKSYRNSIFETSITNQKFTLQQAYKHCDSLSEDGFSIWYLPRVKDLFTLSTNNANQQENNTSIYIKKEYLKILPQVKNVEDLSFWTSNLSIEDGYELGEIVSFAYNLDELENSPLDLSSDKNTKHFVLCKKAEDVINIRWEDDKFLSIYGNNFRISPELKLIGSFDLEDKEPKIMDYKNCEAYFPLKDFLLLTYNGKILYILDLEKKEKVAKIILHKNQKLYLKQIKTRLLSLKH